MSARVISWKFIADGSDAVSEAKRTGDEFDAATKKVTASNRQLEQAAKGVANASKEAGAVQAAAMNGATAAVGRNSAEINKNNAAMKNLDGQIRGIERTVARMEKLFNDVSRSFGLNSVEAKRAAAQIDQLTASKKQLVEQQITLVEKNQFLANGLTKTTEGAGKTQQGFDKLTSNLNLFSGALGSANPLVGQFVSGLGGMGLGAGIAVNAVAFLVGMIIELATAKKEIVKIDTDFLIANQLSSSAIDKVSASHAALTITLLNTADAQKGLEKATADAIRWHDALEKTQRRQVETGEVLDVVMDLQTSNMKDAVVKAQEFAKAVSEDVAVLRVMRDVFGLTNADLEGFLVRAGKSPEVVAALTRALNSDIDSLRSFASELAKSTNTMFHTEQAALRLAIALREIQPPKISVEGIQGLEGAKAVFDRGFVAMAQSQFAPGGRVLSVEEMQRGLEPATRAIISAMKEQAAITGKTKEETLSLYNALKNNLTPAQLAHVNALERQDKNMKAFNDTTDKAAAAARRAAAAAKAYQDTLSTLNKELETARAAVEGSATGDTFAGRRAANTARFEDQKRDLARNNQATKEALKLAEQIYIAHDDKIAADRMNARQELQRRIEAINAKFIENDFNQHKAMINTKVEEDIKAAKALGFAEADLFGARIQFRKAREQEFLNWFFGESVKNAIAIEKALMEIQLQHDRNFIKSQSILLDEQADKFLRQQAKMQALAGNFQQPGGVRPDVGLLDAAVTKMNDLKVSVDEVDKIFGSASRSIEQFNRRLDILAKWDKGDTLGGLKGSLGEILNKFDLAQTAGFAFADALQQAFTQAIVYGQNFIEVFGKVLLAGFLSAVGQKAIAEGTYHILAGIAKLFNPFTAAQGAHEIAAGAALVAFGSALSAGASLITASLQKSATGGGASAAAGSGASSAASGGGRDKERRPEVIPFNTSAPNAFSAASFASQRSAGPTYNVTNIKFDRQGTKDFFTEMMEKEEVIVADDVRGTGRHSMSLRRRVRAEAMREHKRIFSS